MTDSRAKGAQFKNLCVLPIASSETYEWLKKKHYAKRIPQITDAFGLYDRGALIGVVTYGRPASPWLCKGVCGEENSAIVYELNRICLLENKPNQASFLVGNSLRQLRKPRIIVSYADTGMKHTGFVYQACNFLYTGITSKRTDVDTGEKHARHIDNFDVKNRKTRSQKHRYVYFLGNKKQKKNLLNELRYDQQPYPKANIKHYDSSSQINTQMILF